MGKELRKIESAILDFQLVTKDTEVWESQETGLILDRVYGYVRGVRASIESC